MTAFNSGLNASAHSGMNPNMHRFGDVTVRLSVELGRTELPLKEVLSLGEGSVVALNRMTDELLDVTANGHVVARGEVVAQDGKFALRIVSMVGDGPSAPNPVTAGDIHGAPAMPPGAPVQTGGTDRAADIAAPTAPVRGPTAPEVAPPTAPSNLPPASPAADAS